MKLIIFSLIFSLILKICFGTHTETEEKSENAINISEFNMKHRKTHLKKENNDQFEIQNMVQPTKTVDYSNEMKVTQNPPDVNTNFASLLRFETPNNDNSNKISKDAKDSILSSYANDDSLQDIDVGKGPIYYTSWLKYFKYSTIDKNDDFPKHFFKNNQFSQQIRLYPGVDMNSTSSDGFNTLYNYIQSPTFFYVIIFKNTVSFISSRQVQLQQTYDVLNINDISPVLEEKGFGIQNSNGIQDFGNFTEGYCLKVLTSYPNSTTWIICSETQEEKNKLMVLLKKMKLKNQRDKGIINLPSVKENKTETIGDILNVGKTQNTTGNIVTLASDQQITDGYWIVLQTWSQCNLKCGGGNSTMQRMCVPPKSGGAPCEGPAIINKPCNTQPCPNVLTTKEDGKNNNTITNKAIVKIMPFSSRPQRYSKCVIKESDLMLNQKTDDTQNDNPLISSGKRKIPKLQIPVRVVMNNFTVVIFAGDGYETQVQTFLIERTDFKASRQHKSCFFFVEKEKKAELCPFGMSDSNTDLESWDYDFNLFKYQCYKKKDTVKIDKDLAKKLQEKMESAKKELLEEREKELKKNAQKEEDGQIKDKKLETNKIALQAIQKEMNLEDMIKNEEAEREALEEKNMLLSIESERKKSECLMKAIQERELENQYNLKSRQAEDDIESIRQNANEQVQIRRSQLKKAIMDMRKKAKSRQASLSQQLQNVRYGMAEAMGKAYKKGDQSKCSKALSSDIERTLYCQANFAEDFSAFTNCKDTEEFCVLCCDHEFGDMHMNERKSCYNTLCPKKDGTDNKGQGKWVWQDALLLKTNKF